MKDLKKFWETVQPGWRHFTGGDGSLANDKSIRILNRVNKHLLSKLNFKDINNTLDWGCGGGLVAKEISQYSDIGIIDISIQSMDNAKRYLNGINIFYEKIIPDNIEDFTYDGPAIDLIFSNEVIQHFPSLEYFKKVLTCWESIAPKYIAIQVKLDKTTKEASDYYDKTNFLNGLRLAEKDLINYMNIINFRNIHRGYDTSKRKDVKLGYYIFQSK